MNLEEFKIRWIRSKINPILFYLPVNNKKQTENTIYLKCYSAIDENIPAPIKEIELHLVTNSYVFDQIVPKIDITEQFVNHQLPDEAWIPISQFPQKVAPYISNQDTLVYDKDTNDFIPNTYPYDEYEYGYIDPQTGQKYSNLVTWCFEKDERLLYPIDVKKYMISYYNPIYNFYTDENNIYHKKGNPPTIPNSTITSSGIGSISYELQEPQSFITIKNLPRGLWTIRVSAEKANNLFLSGAIDGKNICGDIENPNIYYNSDFKNPYYEKDENGVYQRIETYGNDPDNPEKQGNRYGCHYDWVHIDKNGKASFFSANSITWCDSRYYIFHKNKATSPMALDVYEIDKKIENNIVNFKLNQMQIQMNFHGWFYNLIKRDGEKYECRSQNYHSENTDTSSYSYYYPEGKRYERSSDYCMELSSIVPPIEILHNSDVVGKFSNFPEKNTHQTNPPFGTTIEYTSQGEYNAEVRQTQNLYYEFKKEKCYLQVDSTDERAWEVQNCTITDEQIIAEKQSHPAQPYIANVLPHNYILNPYTILIKIRDMPLPNGVISNLEKSTHKAALFYLCNNLTNVQKYLGYWQPGLAFNGGQFSYVNREYWEFEGSRFSVDNYDYTRIIRNYFLYGSSNYIQSHAATLSNCIYFRNDYTYIDRELKDDYSSEGKYFYGTYILEDELSSYNVDETSKSDMYTWKPANQLYTCVKYLVKTINTKEIKAYYEIDSPATFYSNVMLDTYRVSGKKMGDFWLGVGLYNTGTPVFDVRRANDDFNFKLQPALISSETTETDLQNYLDGGITNLAYIGDGLDKNTCSKIVDAILYHSASIEYEE